MRSSLGKVARLGGCGRWAAVPAPAQLHATAAALAAALAVGGPPLPGAAGSDRGSPPSAASAAASLQCYSPGLSPQQAFAAHSLAHMGHGRQDDDLAANAAAVDEVAQRLREHLAAAFGLDAQQQAAAPATCTHSAHRSAQAVAARLTKQVACPLDPGTPHTLEGALQPSQQPRLVVEAEAPFRLTYANPAWERLVGKDWKAVAGQPCLDVLQGGPVNAGKLEGVEEALRVHARGCACLEYQGPEHAPLPVRVTATPLIDSDGSSTRMLLVFSPGAAAGAAGALGH